MVLVMTSPWRCLRGRSGFGCHQPSTLANISGATMVASDSIMNFGVSATSLPQGDLLVRHRAGVRPVARGRVADLAEIPPERHARQLQILMQHGDDADRKVARN